MKRLLVLLTFSLLLVFALVPSAAADQLKYTGVDSHAVTNGPPPGYAGLYNFTNVTTGAALKLICDDFYGDVSSTPTTYNQYALSSANLSDYKFYSEWATRVLTTKDGDSVTSASTAYAMAAWLALKIFQDPTNSSNQWGALNWAIWSIFSNPGTMTSSSDGSTAADVANWIQQAYNAVVDGGLTIDNAMFAGIRIWVPSVGTNQELIGYVPEPATMILLGTGLLGLGAGKKKLLKARG